MNESAEARPLATAGTGATQERVDTKVSSSEHKSIADTYPRLCNRCAGQFYTDQFGARYACGLMAEAMHAGVSVVNCAHFSRKCTGCLWETAVFTCLLGNDATGLEEYCLRDRKVRT